MTPRTRRRGDDGTTLAELGVVALVAGLLLVALATVFVTTLRSVVTVGTNTSLVADARVVTASLERTLRVAVRPSGQPAAIVTATPDSLEFWALLTRQGAGATPAADAVPAPTRVRYGYDGRCLTQTSNGSTATCLARTTTPPVFTYYPTPDDGTAGTPGPAAIPASPAVAAADLARVQAVRVALTLRDPEHPQVTGVPVVVQVALQNVVADAQDTAGAR